MSNVNKKILILITSEFPFGNGETFLENEIPFLAAIFDEIHILAIDPPDQKPRELPENVKAITVTCHIPLMGLILSLISSLFVRHYRAELNKIRKERQNSAGHFIRKVALVSLSNARFLHKQINSYLRENVTEGNLFLYSYWCNDAAIALALHKLKYPDHVCISRMHRWDLYAEQQPHNYLPFRQLVLSSLNQLYVISEHGLEYMRQKYGEALCGRISVSRLGTIYSGKNTSDSSQTLRIFSCSSLIPRKRVSLIIDALDCIDTGSVDWIHYGSGPLEKDLIKHAEALLNHKANISFCLHGQKSYMEVIEFYNANPVDLFINVSSDEGVPVSIMEAFSFGVPAIATAVGGNIEIIENTINGFLLGRDPEPKEIADMLDMFMLLPETDRKKLREDAFNTWIDKYKADVNYPKFASMLLDLDKNK